MSNIIYISSWLILLFSNPIKSCKSHTRSENLITKDVADIVKDDNYETKKRGRGLEDSGLGVCHQHGMKFNTELNISDIVTVTNISNNENATLLEVKIFWTKIVESPLCVDWLNIDLGEKRNILSF